MLTFAQGRLNSRHRNGDGNRGLYHTHAFHDDLSANFKKKERKDTIGVFGFMAFEPFHGEWRTGVPILSATCFFFFKKKNLPLLLFSYHSEVLMRFLPFFSLLSPFPLIRLPLFLHPSQPTPFSISSQTSEPKRNKIVTVPPLPLHRARTSHYVERSESDGGRI